MQNKYEVVTTIMGLFDENERLQNQNESLQNKINCYCKPVATTSKDVKPLINPIEARIFEEGKKAILEKYIYSWREVTASKDEDGNIKVTKYERWLDEKINKVPDWISKEEFFNTFNNELRTMYNKEKDEALQKLQEESSDK